MLHGDYPLSQHIRVAKFRQSFPKHALASPDQQLLVFHLRILHASNITELRWFTSAPIYAIFSVFNDTFKVFRTRRLLQPWHFNPNRTVLVETSCGSLSFTMFINLLKLLSCSLSLSVKLHGLLVCFVTHLFFMVLAYFPLNSSHHIAYKLCNRRMIPPIISAMFLYT